MARIAILMALCLLLGGGPCLAQTTQPTGQQASSSARVPVPAPSEKAISYYRSGNVLWVVTTLWGLLIPAAFLFTGFSARMRNVAQRIGRRRFFVIGLYFTIFSIITLFTDLPLAYYTGFVREHAYGLSNQTLNKWISDSLKASCVNIVFGVLLLWIPYWLLRKSPRRWWLYTGLLMIPFLLVVVLIAPIWIDPLFNKFGPMQNKTLEAKILALAERAGIEGSRVYEVAKSEDTKTLNAYVTGFGQTKRIVLWDTILRALDEREMLFVMGHEMGHYVLGHIWQLVVVSSMLVLAMLFAIHRTADWLIRRFEARFGFSELADVASLPLVLLLFAVYSLAVTPLALAFTRHTEHEADRFGLELTHDNHAAATAFVKLQQENLGIPRPGWLFKVWRSSHPPVGERIDFANEYRPWDVNGQRPSYDVRQLTFGPAHHFYGYIGHAGNSPYSGDGRFLIALRTTFQDRMPGPDDAADIVLLDATRDFAETRLDETRGWNPQQGAMMYWNPEQPDTQFFFNDRDRKTGKVFTALYDIAAKKRVREFRFDESPVANGGVRQNGGAFTAINYARMARLRPVTGYPGAWDWTAGVNHPLDDGLFVVNPATGVRTLIVSFNEMRDALVEKHPTIDRKALFLNHTLWNREGDRIFFFVRADFDNPKERINVPMTVRPDGSELVEQRVFIGGHPEWDFQSRMLGAVDRKLILYDAVAQQIVDTIGDRQIFSDAEGDTALSRDGRWIVSGATTGATMHYTVMRRADRAFINTEDFSRAGYTGGDLRIDPAPCWNRAGDRFAFPALAKDGTRQMFQVRIFEAK